MTSLVQHVNIGFNPIFKPVNEWRGRYRILKGSAGSGKSVNIAQDYIAKLSDPRYKGANLLVVRKVDETNRDSTFAELQGAIFRMYGSLANKYWRIVKSPQMLESKVTGNRIIFRGMKDDQQREKVKSITFMQGKLTWIWIEEATELSAQDVDILDDRLRGHLENPNLYYQITMTFNPVSSTHWIKGRYFDTNYSDTLAHHSTYKDNRFIDPAYAARMERRRTEDPDGYRIYGLGEWGEIGGLILTNIEICDFYISPENFDAIASGKDFGFNHADALLELGMKDGNIYICRELYHHEKETNWMIKEAKRLGFDQRREMWCDSASPGLISEWRNAGFRAKPVNKRESGNKSSVLAQIDWLKGRKIFIHTSCINTQKEIQQWKWARDSKTNTLLDEPVAFFDDAMAALRYGIERWRRNGGTQIMR